MPHYVIYFLFPIMMIIPLCTDLITMRIPNWIPLSLTLSYLSISIYLSAPMMTIALNLSCSIAVFLLSLLMFERRWIGGGDAKLAAATAIWLGWSSILSYWVIASVLGGLLTLLVLAVRATPLPPVLAKEAWIVRLHDRNSGIPYGIALAIAGLLQYPYTSIWSSTV